jgi:hypothetical protein
VSPSSTSSKRGPSSSRLLAHATYGAFRVSRMAHRLIIGSIERLVCCRSRNQQPFVPQQRSGATVPGAWPAPVCCMRLLGGALRHDAL